MLQYTISLYTAATIIPAINLSLRGSYYVHTEFYGCTDPIHQIGISKDQGHHQLFSKYLAYDWGPHRKNAKKWHTILCLFWHTKTITIASDIVCITLILNYSFQCFIHLNVIKCRHSYLYTVSYLFMISLYLLTLKGEV